jgi:hypothetical protein
VHHPRYYGWRNEARGKWGSDHNSASAITVPNYTNVFTNVFTDREIRQPYLSAKLFPLHSIIMAEGLSERSSTLDGLLPRVSQRTGGLASLYDFPGPPPRRLPQDVVFNTDDILYYTGIIGETEIS